MFATKAGSLRKALWNKHRNKSTDTPPESAPSTTNEHRIFKTQQSVGFEPEISIEESTTSNPCESLSISVEESPNDNSSNCSSPSSARVCRQHSYSATSSIPEDEALDNTTKSNRPSSRLSIKESLRSRMPPFLSNRTRVKSANPVLGVMPSVSLTSPTDETAPKSPLSVNVDCTCDSGSAAMPSSDSPTGHQLLSTSYKPASCQLHYSASEKYHRSNSSSPKSSYQSGSLLVPFKSFCRSESNELVSKRNSLGTTRYSPNFYLPMSDHSTIFDFEDLTNLDPRKYFNHLILAKRI